MFVEIKLSLKQNNIFRLLKYLNACFLICHFFIDSNTEVFFCPPSSCENRGFFCYPVVRAVDKKA